MSRRLGDLLVRLGDRLMSLGSWLASRAYTCRRCGEWPDDGIHDTLAECNGYLAESGRGPCPDPTEHHAFRRRWLA